MANIKGRDVAFIPTEISFSAPCYAILNSKTKFSRYVTLELNERYHHARSFVKRLHHDTEHKSSFIVRVVRCHATQKLQQNMQLLGESELHQPGETHFSVVVYGL